MDREFQRRNNENMWQLFEALLMGGKSKAVSCAGTA